MIELTPKIIHQINYQMARDFIEERLDAETTPENIEKLVRCIEDIEKCSLIKNRLPSNI